MSSAGIHSVTMPKWGLSMTQGKVVDWLVAEGANVRLGQELVEIETEKILSSVEASVTGILRRKVAQEGETVPVKGLLGIIADDSVSDSEIDNFVQNVEAHFVPEEVAEDGVAADGPPPSFVSVQDRKLQYVKQGSGAEAAILIHGFGGDLNNWMFNHPSLAADHTVYALDLPGHGSSSKQVGSGTVSEFATLVNGFMDAVGISKAHLVGHSLGGAIAIQFALAHSERAVSLALIASAALGPEIDGEYIRGFIHPSRRKELKSQLEKLFANPKAVGPQLIDDVLKYKRLDGVELALRTVADQFCPNGRQSVVLRDELSRLSLPVLVIWGSDDRIIPVSHARGLSQSLNIEILEGCGHMVQMEAAQKVNQIISSFWKRASKEIAEAPG